MGSTYLLYCSAGEYKTMMSAASAYGLPEPDATAALGGSELYQRGYGTPDPFWASQVAEGWDPKPTKWVVNKFFGDRLSLVEQDRTNQGSNSLGNPFQSSLTEAEIIYGLATNAKLTDDSTMASLGREMESKLAEMGLRARVSVRNGADGNETIAVTPAASDVGNVISFCARMLGLKDEGSVCACGSQAFVQTTTNQDELKEISVGILTTSGSKGPTTSTDESGSSDLARIYAPKREGLAGMLQGVVHHAML